MTYLISKHKLQNKFRLFVYIFDYNIAFVNSERWLAKSRVDITLCQQGKFPATLLLKFFVLYYKRNIKHFFRIDIQLYQHSWKLEKLDYVQLFDLFGHQINYLKRLTGYFENCFYTLLKYHCGEPNVIWEVYRSKPIFSNFIILINIL